MPLSLRCVMSVSSWPTTSSLAPPGCSSPSSPAGLTMVKGVFALMVAASPCAKGSRGRARATVNAYSDTKKSCES